MKGTTMNDQVQSNHVWCKGLRIHYEDHGAGAPVVLLHGGLVTGHRMWSSHVPALARHHRVLVPDSRGHGRTDNPEGRLADDLMAEDCAAFIEALGVDRPMVMGYSDGAQTALELGIRHPDRIAGLVLGGVVAEPGRAVFPGPERHRVHRAGGSGRREIRASVPRLPGHCQRPAPARVRPGLLAPLPGRHGSSGTRNRGAFMALR
jgi:pimeloyl-ACP methyl ester carboxylesterase